MSQLYTAFVSSTSSSDSIRELREKTIGALYDLKIFPYCMEHFTVKEFDHIRHMIDNSDFMVLLMGKDFGTVDKNGKSITWNEYEYAIESKKPVLVILDDEFTKLINNPKNKRMIKSNKDIFLGMDINEDGAEREKKIKEMLEKAQGKNEKQLVFYSSLHQYSRSVSDIPIQHILATFFREYQDDFSGWIRSRSSQRDIENWEAEHRCFDLRGIWYHYHCNKQDLSYLRIGNLTIEQSFEEGKYTSLKISGHNYGVDIKKDGKTLNQDEFNNISPILSKHTIWSGSYHFIGRGALQGIYTTNPEFVGEFKGKEVAQTSKTGLHRLSFVTNDEQIEPTFIQGTFHDAASPSNDSPKYGQLFLFRSEDERDKKIKEYIKLCKKEEKKRRKT